MARQITTPGDLGKHQVGFLMYTCLSSAFIPNNYFRFSFTLERAQSFNPFLKADVGVCDGCEAGRCFPPRSHLGTKS